MNKLTFEIDYKIVYARKTSDIKTMRVKNCMNEDHAKMRLDKYIKKKYDEVQKVVVVDCRPTDKTVEFFKDMFGFNVVR
jgi:hypothetical protein